MLSMLYHCHFKKDLIVQDRGLEYVFGDVKTLSEIIPTQIEIAQDATYIK